MTTTVETSVKIVPVTGHTGAVIEGVDISGDLDDSAMTQIRNAFLNYKVIFFRGQDQLNDAELEGFTERMGTPIAHPTATDPLGSRYLLNIREAAGYTAANWHTDMTYLPKYPAASILWGLQVPTHGGDTMWANMAAAYDDLIEPLREMADRLWAVHTNDVDFDAVFPDSMHARVKAFARKAEMPLFETDHPIVRVHPETGERVLVIGTYVKRIIGLDGLHSQMILTLLRDHAIKPENTVRWRWLPGDVAMWDNRATMHRSVADFGEQGRSLRRATIEGSVPVSVYGVESRVRSHPDAKT